jgi:hypothetical protein
MAKVTMPLMSNEASGSFGKVLVFASRLGKNVVRKLVTPRNPRTQNQQDTRNAMRVCAAISKWIRLNDGATSRFKMTGTDATDRVRITALATPMQLVWNNLITKQLTGTTMIEYDAAGVAWAANSANATAWETAAGTTLTHKFSAVPQVDANGIAGTPITAGEQFYRYIYAADQLGLVTLVAATPTVYVSAT